MCYVLLLSTTAATELSQFNTDLLRFSRPASALAPAAALQYPNCWHVGSKSVCSCTFRHLHSVDLGFGAPVDWFPEAPDEIAATLELVRVIRQLVERGHRVDCVDYWEDDEGVESHLTQLGVDLDDLSDEQFRLFEDHRFDFRPAANLIQ